VTALLTDDEHVDVATDIVVATRIRAEHERVANACLALKDRPKLRDEADGSRVKVAERRIHGVRGIHVPHSQRTDTPTLYESLPEELFKGQLYGPWTPVDPPNEFTCMELLAGGTRQQREQAGLGPRTLDIGHGWDDTSVSLADTNVSAGVPPRADASCSAAGPSGSSSSRLPPITMRSVFTTVRSLRSRLRAAEPRFAAA
jgi:hypothetical protein